MQVHLTAADLVQNHARSHYPAGSGWCAGDLTSEVVQAQRLTGTRRDRHRWEGDSADCGAMPVANVRFRPKADIRAGPLPLTSQYLPPARPAELLAGRRALPVDSPMPHLRAGTLPRPA